ncbi:MAG: diphthine synthase [Candidatus Aenigmarchaeota archaeon]|nr:diphthine synthase [Candidatus Aenigmarchaeota archaeon]
MALTLIGLGLFDENDLSLRAVEEAKNSDKVYIENYTGKWHGNLSNLENLVGKKIIQLERKDLEDDSNKIIQESKAKSISIFVQGDPLIATTHSALILEARKAGVETKIIHNASIFSAIGETGLHVYKFGPTVTISFPERAKGKLSKSIFETIEENKKRGLHTLCLLDVLAENDKYMTPKEAVEILLKGKVVTAKDKAVVFGKAGSDKPHIEYTIAEEVKSQDTPSVIIIPGKLHFSENEFLESLG